MKCFTDIKMVDMVSQVTTLEEWDVYCKAKFGHKRPYNMHPNKDGPNSLPAHSMISAKVFCEALKDDPKAGIVLACTNLVGLDFGQHHVGQSVRGRGAREDDPSVTREMRPQREQ